VARFYARVAQQTFSHLLRIVFTPLQGIEFAAGESISRDRVGTLPNETSYPLDDALAKTISQLVTAANALRFRLCEQALVLY